MQPQITAFQKYQLEVIARVTPSAMIGHLLNTMVLTVALAGTLPFAQLIVWCAASGAIASVVLYRHYRNRGRAPLSFHRGATRATLYAFFLALPWSVIILLHLGTLGHGQELILIALAVGMAASGTILLAALPAAAFTYISTILLPSAVKCALLLNYDGYLLLGVLALSYWLFLAGLITKTGHELRSFGRADEALKESEERYRMALEAGRLGLFDWDIETDLVRWDERTHAALGLAPGEPLTSRRAIGFAHPDDRENIKAAVARALDPVAATPFAHEWRIIGPDGRARWMETQGRALFRGEGSERKAYRLIGTVRGVTRRKEAELALAGSEARFRATFENAAVGISHLAPGGRWLSVNDKLCEITGYSREELLSLRAEDITHPDDIAEGQRLAERLWAGEIPMYTRAKRTIRKDGKMIWLALTCSLVRKPDNAPDYVITFAQDISKEKQAEAALADSNAVLDSVIENLPAMVFLKRASNLEFVRFNRAGEKLLGYPRDWYLGKNDYDFFPKAQADFFTKVDREVLAGTELREIDDEPIRTRDGRIRYLKTSKIALRDANGTPTYLLGASVDITERKHAEEHTQLLLREVNHRAKNLLAVVQAVARQTAARDDPEEFAQLFSARLAGLAASQDLLVQSDWRGVELGQLIRSQLALFGDLIGTRIALDGPDLKLKPAAAQTMGMALHELATNAGKYGALSTSAGVVDISWAVATNGASRRFEMLWRESCGPQVTTPRRRGFGDAVLVSMVEYGLDAEVALNYPPDGLSWQMSAPAGGVLDQAETPVSPPGEAADGVIAGDALR